MVTKANGPLQEDYNRALRAAKRHGVGVCRIEIGDFAIVLPLDGAYMDKMAQGHLPAPECGEKPKLRGPQW